MAYITPTHVHEAVELGSAGLVREVHETVQTYLRNEMARQTLIESKATSLLSAVGLSMTIAFAFVGSLLEHHATLAEMPSVVRWAMSILLVIAPLLGTVSATVAIYALLISDNQLVPNEEAIFDIERLKKADKHENDDFAVREYRRYLIPHLWKIAQRETAVLDKKGRCVALAQRLFGAFIGCIGVVAVMVCGQLLCLLAIAK